MNKTLTITVIALVAVVMGFGSVAPMIPQAYADVQTTGLVSKCALLDDALDKSTLTEDEKHSILVKAGCALT